MAQQTSLPPADKAALRAQALARRAMVDAETRAAFSLRLAAIGVQLAHRLHVSAASAFYPIRGEPDTLALLAALGAQGFRTALPVTLGPGQRLAFRAWRPGEATAPGPLKIPEPLASAPALEPDLLFVPLACFDRRGHRVGYGAGHYDRTLEALRAARPTTAVGVAYACAQVANLPDAPHDQRMDFIVTERELLDCRGG